MLAPILEPLLSDMNMAAKGMDRVSITGRAMLLERAANILDTLNSTDASELGTFPSRLRALAANVEDHSAGAIAAALLDAADAIQKVAALTDIKAEGSA